MTWHSFWSLGLVANLSPLSAGAGCLAAHFIQLFLLTKIRRTSPPHTLFASSTASKDTDIANAENGNEMALEKVPLDPVGSRVSGGQL